MRADWKGSVLAESDDTVIVEGNAGAAWYYPAPKEAAAQIRYRVAFGRGVRVSVTQI
ncbi:MAG: hypothetical protein ACRD1K_16005 [Acidimicrobiales bacterium]